MGKTTIEWTEITWNPVRGCKEVSPGCTNCYARTFAERWRGISGHPYEAGFAPRFVPDHLADPLGWRKPRTVFVNSMSDLFQGAFSDEEIDAVFGVMAVARRHTFQVLTKRGSRLRKYHQQLLMRAPSRAGHLDTPKMACVMAAKDVLGPERSLSVFHSREWPLPNVWQGVSVESRDYLSRIDDLRSIPAAIRFLSLEPLLEDLGAINLDGIHWVIAGGESGPGARPMNPDWVRSIRDQCAGAGVPFFVKQLGRKPVGIRLKHQKGNGIEEWPEDLRIRQMPARAA